MKTIPKQRRHFRGLAGADWCRYFHRSTMWLSATFGFVFIQRIKSYQFVYYWLANNRPAAVGSSIEKRRPLLYRGSATVTQRQNSALHTIPIRGHPQKGFRRFSSTTAAMISLFGPLGPDRRCTSGENSRRYFRFLKRSWKCNNVEGFKVTADRTSRARRMERAQKPTMIRSNERRFGAHFRTRLRIWS